MKTGLENPRNLPSTELYVLGPTRVPRLPEKKKKLPCSSFCQFLRTHFVSRIAFVISAYMYGCEIMWQYCLRSCTLPSQVLSPQRLRKRPELQCKPDARIHAVVHRNNSTPTTT